MATSKKAPAKTAPAKAAKAAPPTPAPTPKLTKNQLIRMVAEKLGISPKEVEAFLDLLVETAATQTQIAGEFTLPGLGKLVKSERKARTGRNPATGKSIQIPAKTAIKFRVAKSMQNTIVPPAK